MTLLCLSALAAEIQIDAGLDREVLRADVVETRYLVVELKAPETVERQNVHLSLVMDSSDSTYVAGKLDYARQAAAGLAAQLGPGDTLSIVSFDTDTEVHLRQGPITNPARVGYLLEMLTTGGGTNVFGGMNVGLEELRAVVDGVRRMVVLSDGQATVGATDADSLAAVAANARGEGMSVSTLGLGLEFDRNTLMAIADAGGGVYSYINDPDGVAGLFTEELEKASHLAAAAMTVDFEPAAGVTLEQVYGYEAFDGKSTGNGWQAIVGDVHAGETRKVVIKVQVQPTATAIGTVVVQGPDGPQTIPIEVTRSVDQTVINASVARPRASNVGKVVTGSGMASSVGLYDKGLDEGASEELEDTLEELKELEQELGLDFADEKVVLEETGKKGAQKERRRALDDISLEALGYLE